MCSPSGGLISVRLVPLNTEVQKMMVLHGHNPRIEFKCKLAAPLPLLVERLRTYIAKGGNIETVIGYKNELKVAPEIEQLKDDSTKSATADRNDERQVLVWSEATARGLIVRDVYAVLGCPDPLYLYYYWDEVPGTESREHNTSYYITHKGKDDLRPKEYEDFIEMVANVVQNVLTKKKRKRARGKKKRSLAEPSPSLTPAQDQPAKETAAAATAAVPRTAPPKRKEEAQPIPTVPNVTGQAAGNRPDMVIDMEKPFKSIFDKPARQSPPSGYNSSSSFCGPVPTLAPKAKSEGFSYAKSVPAEKPLVPPLPPPEESSLQQPLRKKKCIVPTYEPSASSRSQVLGLVSDSDSRLGQGRFPAVGSVANSMLMPIVHSSAGLFDDVDCFEDVGLAESGSGRLHPEPAANSNSSVGAAMMMMTANGNAGGSAKRSAGSGKSRAKRPGLAGNSVSSIGNNKEPIVSPEETKRPDVHPLPPNFHEKEEQAERLPHPNDAFNICQRPKSLSSATRYRGEIGAGLPPPRYGSLVGPK